MGGDTVPGLAIQVRNRFLRGIGSKPATAPWTADNTLFGEYVASLFSGLTIDVVRGAVFWVGINDCA